MQQFAKLDDHDHESGFPAFAQALVQADSEFLGEHVEALAKARDVAFKLSQI